MRLVVHVFTVPDSLMFLAGQVGFMRQRGYDLRVVTAPGPGLEAFGRREGVPVYPVPMSRRIAVREDLTSVARLRKLFRELRPAIVHAHTPKGGLLGTLAAAAARVPTRIYHMRGLPLATATGVQRALLASTERTSCAMATHVLCVGASLRRDALANHLVSAGKARVLAKGTGNGVDARGRFDPERVKARGPGSGPRIGFVGRLVRDKGVLELAVAWKELRERFPDATLVVAGVFEERDAVPADVRQALEGDPRVEFLGFVQDTPALYASLDVLAFPSHREGFPNVPLEAAAMRLPVVGARATGTIDAIEDGVTGTLVPVGDGRALARAITSYLAEPALAARHGEAARARVLRDFDQERVWCALADFYDAALGARET